MGGGRGGGAREDKIREWKERKGGREERGPPIRARRTSL